MTSYVVCGGGFIRYSDENENIFYSLEMGARRRQGIIFFGISLLSHPAVSFFRIDKKWGAKNVGGREKERFRFFYFPLEMKVEGLLRFSEP